MPIDAEHVDSVPLIGLLIDYCVTHLCVLHIYTTQQEFYLFYSSNTWQFITNFRLADGTHIATSRYTPTKT